MVPLRDMRMLLLAKKLARHSDHKKYKMGAVIARGNKILGVGFNQDKTHPRSKNYTIHAELKAILNARTDLDGATAYVVRTSKDEKRWANAKPCSNCQVLLRSVGIDVAWYTTDEGPLLAMFGDIYEGTYHP